MRVHACCARTRAVGTGEYRTQTKYSTAHRLRTRVEQGPRTRTQTDSSTLRRKRAHASRADVVPAMPGTVGKAVGAGVGEYVGDRVVG